MSEEALRLDAVVIGAGVIGLAVAREISADRSVILLEEQDGFGRETSSRNSEVIHSGIYYPTASNKTKWCLEGRSALYEYCESRSVPYRKCGKFLIAVDSSEEDYLQGLWEHCVEVDVPQERLSSQALRLAEPRLRAVSGIHFPETGIVDSHSYMAALERDILDRQGTVAYRHTLRSIRREGHAWHLDYEVVHAKERGTIVAPVVINCAGLAAAQFANRAAGGKRFEHRFCRGKYFFLGSRYRNQFSRLIYPVPEKHGAGVHVTIDLAGQARLGPDVEWCSGATYEQRAQWYDADWDRARPTFVQAARRYLPDVRGEDLSPGLIGIRAKLFVDGQAKGDFHLETNEGFVSCLGIESPGLTASLAIAKAVKRLL